MANKTSPHILSTASNLLGFCLFVLTALHISDQAQLSIIDEVTTIICLFLAFSSIFSFLSIRTEKPVPERRLEVTADYLFILSLIGITIVVAMIAWNFID